MESPTLLVVGGGIGGAATALRAAQYHIATVWILGDRTTRKSSRVAYVRNIDNMIGVHPGIVQERIVELLRADFPAAAERVAGEHLHISTVDIVRNTHQRIASNYADHVRCIEDRATAAALQQGGDGFRLTLAGGESLTAPYLVLATGVMDRQPLLHRRQGERDLSGVHWLFPWANAESLLYCIRCEGHLTAGRRVAVLGGGNAAAEIAMICRERYGCAVTVLTSGEPITWSKHRARLLAAHGIGVVGGALVDVHGARRGTELHGFSLESGERVEVDLAVVALGLFRVYNELAVQLGAVLEGGGAAPEIRHVMVNASAETSVANLFAVGDMTRRPDEPVMKQIYTAQEYAVRAVDAIDYRRRMAKRAALAAS